MTARDTLGRIGTPSGARSIAAFHRRDVLRLREARLATGRDERFVPQAERDSLFIRARLGAETPAP